MLRRHFGIAALLLPVGWLAFACSAEPPRREEIVQARNDTMPEQEEDGGAVAFADRVEIVRGVPDRGRDPSVVALKIGEDGYCSGALVSPRIVLTARHCLSRTTTLVSCPPEGVQVLGNRAPTSIDVLLGEDIASARTVAHGLDVVEPNGVTLCDADIALLVLDDDVKEVKPLAIRKRGPAARDYVRAVGFGSPGDGDPAGKKLLREHVRVLDVTTAEFTVGEATCSGDSGGPALDEDTGEVIGVVSRGGPRCDGPDVHNVYTRVDTYAWLIEEAFQRTGEIALAEKLDAGSSAEPPPAKRGTKSKPPSDVGAACKTGADCAAGICVMQSDAGTIASEYCSRTCGAGDRCPARYHCLPIGGGKACVNVR